QATLERCMALERSMGDESSQRHRSIGVDAVETWDSVQAHDVARAELATVYLDDQIRTPGEKTAVGAKTGTKVDGLGHRGRLVILEAHRLARNDRARRFTFGHCMRSPKLRAVNRLAPTLTPALSLGCGDGAGAIPRAPTGGEGEGEGASGHSHGLNEQGLAGRSTFLLRRSGVRLLEVRLGEAIEVRAPRQDLRGDLARHVLEQVLRDM